MFSSHFCLFSSMFFSVFLIFYGSAVKTHFCTDTIIKKNRKKIKKHNCHESHQSFGCQSNQQQLKATDVHLVFTVITVAFNIGSRFGSREIGRE